MSPEEVMATQLRSYPERSANPNMPVVDPTRLSIRDLEALLQTTQGKPIDYSAVADVNAARERTGQRQMLGGLAMSMLGGEAMRTPGAQLFKESLAMREPLRANAADVGYVNPESGEFVENPQAARVRDEKVITGRLDARIREEEAKAKIALAQGNAGVADAAKANAETLKLLLASLAAQNANSNTIRAEAAQTRAEAPKPPKSIPVGQVTSLEENVSSHAVLDKLHSTFQDDYSGKGPLSKALIFGERVAGGLAPEKSQLRSNWWSDFKMFQELPMRHKLFGATLTVGEQRAWDNAQKISPGSDPKVVRKAVADLMSAVEARNARLVQQLTNEGKDPSAYIIEGKGTRAPTGASGSFTMPSASDIDAAIQRKLQGGSR